MRQDVEDNATLLQPHSEDQTRKYQLQNLDTVTEHGTLEDAESRLARSMGSSSPTNSIASLNLSQANDEFQVVDGPARSATITEAHSSASLATQAKQAQIDEDFTPKLQ